MQKTKKTQPQWYQKIQANWYPHATVPKMNKQQKEQQNIFIFYLAKYIILRWHLIMIELYYCGI